MATLFKVWSAGGGKKAVVAGDRLSLIEQGCIKLELKNENVKTFLEDGTEIDDDESLKMLPAGTVIYLLREFDKKPWLSDNCSVGDCSLESGNHGPMSAISGNKKGACNLNLRNLPWPRDFDIDCSKFSSNLLNVLQSGNFEWAEKVELMNHLSSQILMHTDNPSYFQRNQVAKNLIEKFPSLKTTVGDGYHGWSNRIYDKMREIRRKKRKYEDSFGSDSVMRKKKIPSEKNTEKTQKQKEIKIEKLQKRGEINWAPPPPDGEDSASMKAHKEWLKTEFIKGSSKDAKSVVEKMELCFSLRRAEINSCQPLSILKKEYPFMFTIDGIIKEFYLFMAVNIDEIFLSKLNQLAPKLLSIAQQKKKLPSEAVNVINTYNAITSKHVNDSLTASLLLLPFILFENPDLLYKVYPTETALDSLSKEIKTPHVVVIGSPFTSAVTYIIAEGEIMFEGIEFVQTVIACMAFYYCCNIQYPAEAKCTYNFIQIKLLNLQNSETVPRKVHSLIEKLNT